MMEVQLEAISLALTVFILHISDNHILHMYRIRVKNLNTIHLLFILFYQTFKQKPLIIQLNVSLFFNYRHHGELRSSDS